MIKKCMTIEDGVRNALEAYQAEPAVQWQYISAKDGDYADTLELDGVKYPLFWWRCDPQINTMQEKAPERKICSMKLNRSGAKSQGLERLLYKELDIAEYIMGSSVCSVMNFRNENAMNMLCTMENDRVALFELAAVLHDETPEQGRHSYWGEDGMASDRVVSQKVASEAIYLFTEDQKDPETYNDLFIYMYGLDRTDTLKATAIAEIIMGRRDISDWLLRDAHYRRCIEAADRSAKTMCRLTVEEV